VSTVRLLIRLFIGSFVCSAGDDYNQYNNDIFDPVAASNTAAAAANDIALVHIHYNDYEDEDDEYNGDSKKNRLQ